MDLLYTTACLLILYLFIRKDIYGLKPKKKRTNDKTTEPRDEHVYIIANPSFRDGIFKIGLTTREVSKRLSELRTTGVPTAFEPCIVLKTDNCKRLEKHLHNQFAHQRVDPRREFFNLTTDDIFNISKTYCEEIVAFDYNALGRALNEPPARFKAFR